MANSKMRENCSQGAIRKNHKKFNLVLKFFNSFYQHINTLVTNKIGLFTLILTWKTVSKALMIESKLDVGVPSGKLSWPPKNCIPSRAKIKMNRKSRRSRDMIDDKAFIRAITRFLNGDQYLKNKGFFTWIFSLINHL